MTPQELVPDFETCKKLKALGWDQDIHFEWFVFGSGRKEVMNLCVGFAERFPAPTAAEILAELPYQFDDEHKNHEFVFKIYWLKEKYHVLFNKIGYVNDVQDEFRNKNLAQVLAELWIWWKENYKEEKA